MIIEKQKKFSIKINNHIIKKVHKLSSNLMF